MKKIAILASGRGSNFEAIVDAIGKKKLSARITKLITNREDAHVLERAREKDIPYVVLPSRGLTREAHELSILEELKKDLPDFLVLAGYQKILTSVLIDAFDSGQGYSRIVNIHPSLLPAFPGLNAYQKAFDFGCRQTGVTVHLVNAEVDQGPICAQEAFSMAGLNSVEAVEAQGLVVEHKLYPKALSWILTEEFQVEKRGDRTIVCPS